MIIIILINIVLLLLSSYEITDGNKLQVQKTLDDIVVIVSYPECIYFN